MDRIGKYSASDKMADLVVNNYRILLVMSRFGIGLGFAEHTIDEVCREHGVDTETFMAVANMLLHNDLADDDMLSVSPLSLLIYLHNSHDYFLGFRLPGIRRDLVRVLGKPEDDLTKAIIKYFDEYVEEVRKHMSYEEEMVFPYVRALMTGTQDGNYNIEIFHKHHDQVETKLREFKQILIKYYPGDSSNELNGVLFDIFNCEYDLASHNEIEDHLFIPLIKDMERKLNDRK
jgi:regulator of cell morphogenesis and NO signaling